MRARTRVVADRGERAVVVTRARTASAVALVAALALSACGSSGSPPPVTPTATASPSPSVSQSPSPSASASASACPGTTHPGAIYYVADVEGPRLYREFTQVPGCPGGAIGGAVQTMFSEPPKDPDYTSLWPSTTKVLSVTTSGSVATVDVSDFVEVGAAFESAAVQQLVWTATAADKTVTKVQLLVQRQDPAVGALRLVPAGRACQLARPPSPTYGSCSPRRVPACPPRSRSGSTAPASRAMSRSRSSGTAPSS